MANLKNASKKQKDDPVIKLLKEAEFKIKAAEKELMELNKVKVKEMGPWGKDYRFQFSFRTNNDDTNGDGAKLYLYAKA